jgi:hypothetical protein
VKKRGIIIVVVILAAGIAALGYYFVKEREILISDPYRAISPKTALIVETSDLQSLFNSLTSGSGLTGALDEVKEFTTLYKKFEFLADLFNRQEYKDLTENNPVLISFLPFADDKTEIVVAMGVDSNLKPRVLKEILTNTLTSKFIEREINDIDIFAIPYKIEGKVDTVFISMESSILICSTLAETLVEAYSIAENGADVRTMPGFSRVFKASGANEDKLFVVYDNLPPLLGNILNNESVYLADRAASLAGSSALDVFIGTNTLTANGYTESIDPSDKLFDFKSDASGYFDTYSVLPATTGFFVTLVPEALSVRSTDSGLPSSTVSLAESLKDYIGGEITQAYIDIKGRPIDENKLVIYKLKDRAYAEKLFLDAYEGSDIKGEIMMFKPDDQVEMPVYLTPFRGFGSAILPDYIWNIKDDYFSFYDDYLVTGSSYVAVSRLLYDNILNKTLANDVTFREFENTLPSVSGCFLYLVPSRAVDFFAGFLNQEANDFLKNNREIINKIQAFGYQLSSSNEMIYNSLSLQYREEAIFESDTEWETLLDTVAAIKPFFFTNHNTGAKEIFIQDLKNNIYLINAAGRVLWKVPLRERINGSVYMVDIYKNGRNQILFAGKEFLHIIDRNGNYVDRFPVKLRSPSTNSLALFDYDNNKNYRLLIAGEDRQVYAYDISGNLVRGWNLFKTGSKVTSEVSWLRVSGKDYLVVSDQNSIYFLDRTGNKRLTLKDTASRSPGSALRLVTGSSPSVVCISNQGELQHIYFDGNVKKYDLGNLSANSTFDMFDITGDGVSEYVVIDRGVLYLYDSNRNRIFGKDFGTLNLEGPIGFVFSSNNRKIGVYDPEAKLIYLVDRNGDIMEGFPLKGASLFSIGHLADRNKWSLIVGGSDSFLYNYKIETQ